MEMKRSYLIFAFQKMVRCPHHDAYIRYNCPELCHCFCDSNDITYDGLHPQLVWLRTKTLGRGDDCCDFCLKLRGKDYKENSQ